MNTPVSNIMTTGVRTIDINKSLIDAKNLFNKYKIRHLPVVHNEKLVGILSKTDVLRMSFGDTYGEDETDVDNVMYDMLTIDEVMKSKPICVNVDSTVKEAAEIFASNEFHALPVLENQKLVGIVTTTDIIKFLLNKIE